MGQRIQHGTVDEDSVGTELMTANPTRSFFSIAAWYAMYAAWAAAAITVICYWLVNFGFCQRLLPPVSFILGAIEIFSFTSIIASIVSLFGIRRHGWRAIVWKSLVGLVLSSITFFTVCCVFENLLFEVMRVLPTHHIQK